jgi:hypothetical protein
MPESALHFSIGSGSWLLRTLVVAFHSCVWFISVVAAARHRKELAFVPETAAQEFLESVAGTDVEL